MTARATVVWSTLWVTALTAPFLFNKIILQAWCCAVAAGIVRP